jgi:hypothetical protein
MHIPEGWIASGTSFIPHGFKLLGSWTPKTGRLERLSLASSMALHDSTNELNGGHAAPTPKETARIRMQFQHAFGPSATIIGVEPTKLCDGRFVGWYVKLQVDVLDRRIISEDVFVSDRRHLFSAAYVRTEETSEDPAAHLALFTLCP